MPRYPGKPKDLRVGATGGCGTSREVLGTKLRFSQRTATGVSGGAIPLAPDLPYELSMP